MAIFNVENAWFSEAGFWARLTKMLFLVVQGRLTFLAGPGFCHFRWSGMSPSCLERLFPLIVVVELLRVPNRSKMTSYTLVLS